jgi:L-carnitine CoA-transferase
MTLAALLKRNQTGKGESFDIAQYELMIRLQANYPTDYLRYGLDYIIEGNHSRICAGYGTYSCKDGNEIYMLFLNPGVLKKGLPILGLEYGSELFPEGSSFVPVDTLAAEVFEAAINEFCKAHTAEEAEAILASKGVPCSRLLNYADAVSHPHYQAREVFTTWTAADGATQIPGVNIVPKTKNHPGQIWRGAPNIGMDNEDILEELGIPKETMDKLYAEGKLGRREYFESK